MIYKCKQCGFKDMTDGIMAHLVMNRCGKIEGYNMRTSDITKYADPITQKQLKKEQDELNKKGIADQKSERERKPIVKEETEINKEGKEVTKTGFEVEKNEKQESKKD